MKVRFPKDIIYQVLFIVCIVTPYFYNYELTFSVWCFTALYTLGKKYSVEIIKHIVCFIAILAIAFIVMFYYDYDLYYILRDFAYLIKPVVGLLVGYQLVKKLRHNIFRLIVITGVVLAILHMYKLFDAVVIQNARDIIKLRHHAGYFSDFEVYSLILLVFYKRFDMGFTQKQVLWFSAIIALSSFLYLARTNYIQFVIMFIAMKGYFAINKRSIIVMSSVLMAAIIGYGAILYINPRRNGDGLEALLYKIKIAPTEPFKTRISKSNWKAFHDNYRSYENITTIRQLRADGTEAVMFGKGLGSTVDLNMMMWLGDQQLRYISILHNGFMTVFLKSGLFGVAFFIISIFLLFKRVRSDNYTVRQINFLMIGTGVFMIISAWVFMGFYFTADTKAILVGLFICYREKRLKQASA